MNRYLRLLNDAILADELISAGDIVVIGVSGGADSVALLMGLYKLAPELGCNLAVAHINHGLRGEDADIDEIFVKELSNRLGIPFYSEKANILIRSKNDGISLEMAARAERYEFFVRAAENFDTRIVATAHTADDQAETVLLKLARGAGLDGLSGIANKTEQHGLCLIRPLINITRSWLIEFLNENDQDWREDASNNDSMFLRNRVRHELLPWLKDNLNYSIKETLCRTAEILRDESIWLDLLCRELFDKYFKNGQLDASELRNEPVAARRRVLRLWLSDSGVNIADLSYSLIRQADELLCRDNAGRCSIQLPNGYSLTRQYNKLFLETINDYRMPDSFSVMLKVPCEIILSELKLRITASLGNGIIKQKTGKVGDLPAKVSISKAAIGKKPLYVRSWRAGDRMKPLGIEGSQKLQDVFVNEKVPVKQRALIPVVECDNEIIWIPNFRIARGWEVLADDALSVHLYIENIKKD